MASDLASRSSDSHPIPAPHIIADVSLIATTLNEAPNVADFLARIASQTRLPCEIVIVDGGSSDGTYQVLEAWRPPPGVEFTVISSPGANISRGRNEAIDAATGVWVAVTDAGTFANIDWLEQLASGRDDDVDVVCGFFAPKRGTFFSTSLAAVITPTLTEINPRDFLPSSRSVLFRREFILRVGGYPEWLDYCEDLVVDLRLKQAGASFEFIPDAVVTWEARPSFRTFFIQYFRYSRGDGKSGLWPRRHAVRYVAYFTGIVALGVAVILRAPTILLFLALGYLAYIAKPLKRVWARRSLIRSPFGAALLTPIVVFVGDIAKMLGYPVGRAWRMRNGNPSWRQ